MQITRTRTMRRRVQWSGAAIAAGLLCLVLVLPALGAAVGPTKLEYPAVTPRSGTTNTLITFSVSYRSTQGTAPEYVRVAVGSTTYAMTATGTSWKQGVEFSVATRLPAGVMSVLFEARDAEKFVDQKDGGTVSIDQAAQPTPAPTPSPEPNAESTPPPAPTPSPTSSSTSQTIVTLVSPTPSVLLTASLALSSGSGTGFARDNEGIAGPISVTGDLTTSLRNNEGIATIPSGVTGSAGSTSPASVDGTGSTTTPTPDSSVGSKGSPSPESALGAAGIGSGSGGSGSGGSGNGAGSGGSGSGNAGSGALDPSGGAGGAGPRGSIGDLPGHPGGDPAGLLLGAAAPAGVIERLVGGAFDSAAQTPGIEGPGHHSTIPALLAPSVAAAAWMAFMLFKKRRDEAQTAPDAVLRSQAATGLGISPDAGLAEPEDPEELMPRWRRPSLLVARKADPIRSPAPVRPAMAFTVLTGGIDAQPERRRVRYTVAGLFDQPDELRSTRIGEVAAGDEVQVEARTGSYLEVLCPNGRRGWVHRTALGPPLGARGTETGQSLGDAEEPAAAENALAALLAARSLQHKVV